MRDERILRVKFEGQPFDIQFNTTRRILHEFGNYNPNRIICLVFGLFHLNVNDVKGGAEMWLQPIIMIKAILINMSSKPTNITLHSLWPIIYL